MVVEAIRQPLGNSMGRKQATPKRNKNNASPRIKQAPVAKQKVKAVDLVTGKATIEYFFDPSLELRKSSSGESSQKSQATAPEDPRFFASKHLFVPCTIIKPLDEENGKGKQLNGQPYAGPTLVKTSDGVLHKISDSTKLVPLNAPDDYVGCDDVLHLPQISEASLLNTLRIRYKRDDIYTSAGPILISINPYKAVSADGDSIYSDDHMMVYRVRSEFDDGGAKPPHLFQIADRAYTALMESIHSSSQASHLDDEDPVSLVEHHSPAGMLRNQSILVSGESGAGKTEATKIIMKYLARITRKASRPDFIQSPDGRMIAALEDRVLSSNPLLETFGNAQTLRNDNSSRFGKFIHIYFNMSSGSITGASISNYLLEKTRITQQVENERNYHVFYQLLTGADGDMLSEFGLERHTSHYSYLGSRESVKSEQDASAYVETIRCLESIGLPPPKQKDVFSIVAAVLHLGNVQFEEHGDDGSSFHGEGDHAKIRESSLPSLKMACCLLGIDEDKLSEAILTKSLVVNGKTIKKRQSVALAEDKRDSLAKLTYSSLFLWLVKRVNETLSQTSSLSGSPKRDHDEIGFIGVLDIYGFECFEINGYEQLLINYCNEKLQRHFNRHLFEVEQQIYLNEGVDWTYITFNDNRPCLELIEGGNGCVGILNTLDDAWGGMGSSVEKDNKFVTNLHKLFGPAETKRDESDVDGRGHKNFITPKFGNDRQFIIVHYAGEVRYTAEGFVEKNMDSMSNELRELVGDGATRPLPREVFGCSTGSNSSRSTIRGVSVGSQFRTSLQALVADLERTQPHYVRCIKPNATKAPGVFQSGEILKQLRYSGMMEAIRIRREGYAFREDHESFYHRFSVLLSAKDISGEGTGIAQLVRVLSGRLHVTDADWQIGHSKIFLRRELAEKLERLARLRVHVAARALGRFGRAVAHKRISVFLVSWARFRLHMLKFYRRHRAVTKLAAAMRRHRQAMAYNTVRKGFVRLQAENRRKLATIQVKKLRDPFYDVTFRECQEMLRVEKNRLEAAVSKKDFRLAATLEANIVTIEAAVERKRPLTRSVLEEKISNVQLELDTAVEKKAYAACGPLQDQLDALIAKRADLPTIDELRMAVRGLEDEVALAAKRRDFAAAAAGQGRLDEARSRLADALAADEGNKEIPAEKENNLGFESRAQLELEISDLSAQIKEAVDSRDFSKASSLQHVLEERERLRLMFPTAAELQEKLKHAMARLDDVVSKKDFAAAANLNEEIARLQAQLETEKASAIQTTSVSGQTLSVTLYDGEIKSFESRGRLEKAINETSASLSKVIAKKDFKLADAIQSDVDQLVKLRDLLPSLDELQRQVRQKKQEMDQAIAKKQFAKADEINGLLEELARRVEAEKNESKPYHPNKQIDLTSIKSTPVIATSSRSIGSFPSALSAPLRAGPPMEVSSDSVKSVRKLRPATPMICLSNESILSVSKMLTKKRANASIVVDESSGQLVGIVTDTDFTRRLISKSLDPATTLISSVMTPNPTCVSMADLAVDALTTMVENHFRHLPVVDIDGTVAGLLDISKCLTDAIAKLETQDEQSVSTAEEVVKQVVSQQASGGTNAAALQSLLSKLMNQAGTSKSIPSLRSLLHQKPSTIVRPYQSVREACLQMAEHRHAALIVDDNSNLVGIFGFKDAMSRCLAKELDLDKTPVSVVMTTDPVTILPDSNVIEALHAMSDHRVLSLPVCEKNGEVVGVLDVMDVIYGCGGAEGWRSVFASAMDIEDDVSDVTSVHSATSNKRPSSGPLDVVALSAVKESVEERPVSRLRPSKPIVTTTDDTILRAAKLLASKRSSAALIVDPTGSLAGIMTDKDVTCRVIASRVDPSTSCVVDVMTPNPTCVSSNDAAMDALTLMVENRFRHLPVIDDQGAVVGTLDIVKCLTSIIGKLEKTEKKSSRAAKDAVRQVVDQHGATGAQAEALQQLLGNLLSQATGGKAIPSLRSLLHEKPSTVVSPSTSVRNAGIIMAEYRHAALVVDIDGHLVGVFTFKDMMCRAVANEIDIDSVPVSEVMTADPETVLPDISVLEALRIMADNKFLTLPVCESNGNVLGVVDALDVIYGCGGAEGWRSVFSSAMEGADDATSVSAHSKSVQSGGTGQSKIKKKQEKVVAKLRPAKPVLSLSTESIVDVAQLLQRKRGDASLVVSPDGSLAGILTDTDFTRRVVAKDINPETTPVSEVMTPDPTCVALSDPALEALTIMVENHFRHLPVVDDDGAVVGLLDIGKCLNDAIERLERQSTRTASTALDVVKTVTTNLQGADSAQAAALQALLGTLMSKAVGGQALPTLRSLLHQKPSTVVTPTSTIREAALLMAESRHAALVVDEGRLVGIFGFKDMMNRCVAKRLDFDLAPIGEVMTPDPESVSPDLTVLEALYIMYDHKFLTLPVCEANGSVVGIVDVMDVIYGCGGTEGWRSIFTSAIDTFDDEDSKSIPLSASKGSVSPANAVLPSDIPANLEFAAAQDSLTGQRLFGDDASTRSDSEKAVFKVSDSLGKTHRIKSDGRVSTLQDAISEKTGIPRNILQLQYVDEEGDPVTMTSDDDVAEAWNLAKKTGAKVIKLSAIACETKAKAAIDQQMMIAAGVAGVAAMSGLVFLMLRPKSK